MNASEARRVVWAAERLELSGSAQVLLEAALALVDENDHLAASLDEALVSHTETSVELGRLTSRLAHPSMQDICPPRGITRPALKVVKS